MSHPLEPLWQAADETIECELDAEILLHVNGHPLIAKSTDTVATALLRAGYTHFAISAKTGLPLAPTCLMGVCFGCVCTINGRTGTQACLEPVRDGLVVTTDNSTQ
ncbi:MAG: hypothetical protein ACI9UN_000751 [Granulosicoccus sp.]|jgi:hypothetical protein